MRILIICLLSIVTVIQAQHAPGIVDEKKDAKHRTLDKPAPPEDPALAAYGIYAENAPTPEVGEPMTTKLPLVLKKGDRIAFVGNTLLDRGGQFGFFEAMLYQSHPDLDL
ncbi:MAG: hypothetical protein P1U58_06820, partial [Verrucomicrobiales bacterium]|nr:hypothetical protein [Verrucomicrobiales bacterium]